MYNAKHIGFRIKDIEKIFSISPKKAEYYEKNGIISTIRDSKNNYRYFNLHNICEITRAKMYRAFNISIKDTVSLIEATDLKPIGELFESKISELEIQLKHKTLLLKALKSKASQIKKIMAGKNEFEIIDHPPIHYSTINATNYYPDIIASKLERWRKVPEFSDACISYTYNKDTNNYDIGLGMCMDHHFYEETINDGDLVFDANHVLHAIIPVNEEDVFNPLILEPIFKYAESNDIKLKNEILCRTFLTLKGEKDLHKCYFEFFVKII